MSESNIQFDFSGKHVVITGGTRGIGKATVLLFHKAGATVHFQYKSSDQRAKDLIHLLGNERIYSYKTNFNDPDAIEDFVSNVFLNTDKIDILVNNAGVYHILPFQEGTYEDWKEIWNQTMNINLNSPAGLSYLVAQKMIGNQTGRIINISSRGAYRGEPHALAYGASKAAMISLSQSMAIALAPSGIKVYAIAPGFVHTEMSDYAMKGDAAEEILRQSPLHRIAEPNEIARTIAFLASDGQDYLTGSVIHINGASYLH